MRFYPLQLPGVVLIEPELREDERGVFARTWCQREFAVNDLDTRLVQCSFTFSHQKGTLRGMYYQDAPHAESRVIRCTRGSVYAVAVDLRRDTPTFKRWEGAELTADNRTALYVPAGCALGFLTLEDNTEVQFQYSEFFHPELARGVRYDDPAFGILWPQPPTVISPRDLAHPPFDPAAAEESRKRKARLDKMMS